MVGAGQPAGRAPYLAGLAAAVALAAWLRVQGLGDQVVLGDESHTIRAAVSKGPGGLISSYSQIDFSIPLALWDWLLLRTVGLDEWGMRFPVVMAGLLLVAAMAALTGSFGRLEAVVAAALAALLPLLVFYSRFARPYVFVVLFTVLALVGWRGWLERGVWSRGVLFALAAAGALFSHVTCAPSVFFLWGAFLVHAASRRRAQPKEFSRSLSALAISAGTALLLFAPGFPSLLEVVSSKSRDEPPSAWVWWKCLHALYGTRSDALLVWLLVSTGMGFALGLRRHRWLSITLAGIALAQFAAVQVAAPFQSFRAIVVARYTIAALPAIVFFTSAGLAAQARSIAWLLGRAASPAVARATTVVLLAAVLALLALQGPLPEVFRPGNVFTNDIASFADPDEAWAIEPARIPSFYRSLEEHDAELSLIEVPWARAWNTAIYAQYHYRHGHTVRIGTDEPRFLARGVRFRSFVPLTDLGARLDGVDYVIVHKNLCAERAAVTGEPLPEGRRSYLFDVAGGHALETVRKVPELEEVLEDEWIAVFRPARGR